MSRNPYLYLFLMAAVTYAVRVLPLTLLKRRITCPILHSFLYYVPYVTLAVDRTTFPLGGALVYRTSLPQQAADGSRAQPRPITGIGLAQDTGGAIKYRRIDLFCGSGDRAAYEAGHLNVAGDVWLLLAR